MNIRSYKERATLSFLSTTVDSGGPQHAPSIYSQSDGDVDLAIMRA